MDNQPTVTPTPDGPGISNVAPTLNQPEPKINKPQVSFNSLTKYALFIVILILCVAGTYYWQHNKVNSLNKQVVTLKSQLKSTGTTPTTSASNSSASSSNKNSNNSLSYAESYGSQSSSETLNITNGQVKVLSAFYSKDIGGIAYQLEQAVIEIQLTNTSKDKQTYNLDNYSLQTPDGTIESSPTYHAVGSDGPSSVELASMGKVSELLIYPITNDNGATGTGYLSYIQSNTAYSCTGNSCTSNTGGSSTTSKTSTNSSAPGKVAITFKKPLS